MALAGLSFNSAAHATVVYSEGYESGVFGPGWSVGHPYYADCQGQGNCVVSSAGHPAVGPQAGNFLYHGGTATGPEPADHRFFVSASFSVTANTDYILTFYLADAWHLGTGAPYTVPVDAQINGTSLAGTVLAAGAGWNQINLNWNSGAATSAIISLHNEYQLSAFLQSNPFGDWGFGNDFAVDSISLTSVRTGNPVPEPGSMLLLGLGLLAVGAGRRRMA